MTLSRAPSGVLLLSAIAITAVVTHWVDRSGSMAAQLVSSRIPAAAAEGARTVRWLDSVYASQEGLQRAGGLCAGGHPDDVALGAWVFDRYLHARVGGATEEGSRAIVEAAIRESPEWREKHSVR